MSDEELPFYSPFRKPPPPPAPKPRELLQEFRLGGRFWRIELLDHGAWGIEAQFWRDDWLVVGRRFDTCALATQWAMLEREAMECLSTSG